MSLLSIHLLLHVLMAAAWAAFFGVFIHAKRKQPSGGPKKQESTRSRIGIFLQGVSFFLMGFGDRTPWRNSGDLKNAQWSLLAAVAGLAILAGSAWLAGAAIGVLGKQWSLTARLVEGHELVTGGPYRFVRHPIYTALFGMLSGSLLMHTRLWMFAASIPVFLVGTWIRIREEDRLLEQQFGRAFKSYKGRVPALIPGIW
ncbi:MAG TPA: isoprenylcysteine carboxylmethyltransferase family protein [Acidobacteriota bacterium]